MIDLPKIRLSVSVELETYVTIKNLSEEQNETMAEIVQKAIDAYLESSGVKKFNYWSYLKAQAKKEALAEKELNLF